MSGEYHCAHCEADFLEEGAGPRPACPTCGQTASVRAVESSSLVEEIRRQWFVVFGILFIAGAAFAIYQWWLVD